MFGRRKREERDEESAREAERRALFEELAKRPESVCPFLGLASARAGFRPEPNGEHRCYAFGDPSPLSDEQQRHVCLERGYSNCPRYLRGVLVIPTDELEALRRPQAAAPPPPIRPAAPAARSGGGRWLIVPLLLLLLAAAGGGWYLVQNPALFGAASSATPTASAVPSAEPSTAPSTAPSAAPSTAASGIASSNPLATPTPLPTPTAGDVFIGYEVGVGPSTYTVFRVSDQGTITESKAATFGGFSHAAVVRREAANGLRYWQTTDGGLIGWSYVAGRSGTFQIRRLYRAPDGSRHAIVLLADEL